MLLLNSKAIKCMGSSSWKTLFMVYVSSCACSRNASATSFARSPIWLMRFFGVFVDFIDRSSDQIFGAKYVPYSCGYIGATCIDSRV